MAAEALALASKIATLNRMTRPPIIPILLAGALAACQDAPANALWTGHTDTLADTITVTTVSGTISGRPPIVIDSVTVLWGADSLSRHRGIAHVAGVLAVAERDPDLIYVISLDGEFLRTPRRLGSGAQAQMTTTHTKAGRAL